MVQFFNSKCEEPIRERHCVVGMRYLSLDGAELAKISCPGCGSEISQANYSMSAKRIILWRGSVGYLLPLVMEVSSVARFQRQQCSGVYEVTVGSFDSRELNRFVKRSFDGPGLQVREFKFAFDDLVLTITNGYNNIKKLKLSKSRVAYYSNTTATKQILLIRAGDVEQNPGWVNSEGNESDYLQNFAREIGSGSNNLNVAHINIRSLRNKLDEVKVLMQVCRFDILAITETHLNQKISNKQLEIDNYKIVRRDRNSGAAGEGCLVYINNHICSSRLKSLEVLEIEGIWLKISINSTVFIVGTIYRPPDDNEFFGHFRQMLERVWMKHRNVMIVGDFNCDFSRREGDIILSTCGKRLHNLLIQFEYSVANNQSTRVTKDTSTLIDLVITSKAELIKHTMTLELGISDHKLVNACLMTKIKRPPPKIVKARSYKHFDQSKFVKDIEEAPWSAGATFDDVDDCYQTWLELFNGICDRHAPYKEIKIRRKTLPWITPQIRHKMNVRYKTLLKARQTKKEELWAKYRELRNSVTKEVRLAKTKYYTELFDKVRDCKSYWKLIKNATNSQKRQPILGIRKFDGSMETSDQGKADLLNEHFSKIGEKLANKFPVSNQGDCFRHITRITPTVMHIALSTDVISRSLKNLKPDKASGPDNVLPKLLKFAGDALIPSLMSLYTISMTSNVVPKTWKSANVTPLFKKEDETDKQNYRPISLLCVPGKLMETNVCSTINYNPYYGKST